MANKLFPEWENANKEIETLFVNNFSVYVNLLNSKKGVKLYYGFLPYDLLNNTVTNEELTKERLYIIKKSYKAFMNWISVETNIETHIKLQNSINLEKCKRVRTIVNAIVADYEADKNVSLETIFRACLGIGDINILPRQLQKEIYGEVIS